MEAHQPLFTNVEILIPTDSLWYMLSGSAKAKHAEENIVKHLKSLCRMYRIPINKSKDVMLKAIRNDANASGVLVKSYFEWYKLNTNVSKHGDDAAPHVVAVPVGSVEHMCNS